MAYTPEEVKWFQDTAEEMTRRIADGVNTSGEAAVDYSRIGRICVRALAKDAAIAAKRAMRANHAPKFQEARQARSKKNATASQGPATSQTRNQGQQKP